MRRNDVLIDMEQIIVIYQYLYMSEDNFITIDNGMAKLEIRMNEDGRFHAKNLNFPDLPDLDYTDVMNVSNMLGIIAQLKKNPPIEFPNSFKTRWEEVTSITNMNIAQNKMSLDKRRC